MESSRTPSYVSASFGGSQAVSATIGGHEGAVLSSGDDKERSGSSTTTVTKVEAVVIKTEEKQEKQESQEAEPVAPEAAEEKESAAVEQENTSEEEPVEAPVEE